MRPSAHEKFILSPITSILTEAVSASAGVGDGIETFPLCDYVMQSVFLKMTGFQEQKMKCVCWELASADYEYRYEFTKKPLGECSSYKDKQAVYKDLINQIKKHGLGFTNLKIDSGKILADSLSEISEVFAGTNLSIWTQKAFSEYGVISKGIKKAHIMSADHLFLDANLVRIYNDHLYRQRNRVAHNTSSYQQNLPTLKTLISDEYKFDNYFLFFLILVIIDKIFTSLYAQYLALMESNEI